MKGSAPEDVLPAPPGTARGESGAKLEDLPLLGEDTDLAFAPVYVDANVFHG